MASTKEMYEGNGGRQWIILAELEQNEGNISIVSVRIF